MKSFDEWFEDNFGKEPSPGISLVGLWEDADKYRRLLKITESKIKDRERWIDNRNAAMTAWEARRREKK
jgi:hypothetical protein